MLRKLSIENFFSIAEKQEINFAIARNAPNVPSFKRALPHENKRLPAIVGFFGPNASGKSTVLRAATSLLMVALHSFGWPNSHAQLSQFFQPYRKKEWWGTPSKILIEFDASLTEGEPSAVFRYELHVAHQANDFGNKVISYEALHYAPKGTFRRLFIRTDQQFDFGSEFDIPNKNDPRTESIRPDASVISTLAQFNHKWSKLLCMLIGKIQTDCLSLSKMLIDRNALLSHYHKDQQCLNRLNQELRRLDIGLESMSVEQGNQGLFAKFHHVGLDHFIFLEEESRGTQRFLEIFVRLHSALETGSIAIIDELDTELHPLLLPELLQWFTDSERNKHNAQLFFTAHNPVLLDYLEKEQIFFTKKPYGESTIVYGAKDIKGLRREPALMKKYLSGELDAIPQIG